MCDLTALFQFQDRRCVLCEEHCPIPAGKGGNVVDWPKLDYPGKNAQCIGYCPLNCGWEEPECPADCEKEQEEYFKNHTDPQAQKLHCYPSLVMTAIVESGRPIKESDAFMKGINTMIKEAREKDEFDAYPDYWKEVPALKIYAGKPEDDQIKTLQRRLAQAWPADRDEIIRLTKKITRKRAIVPNLDGQFGGEACIRPSDKKQLTIRQDDDEKYDKKTMTNGPPKDEKEFNGVGHFLIIGRGICFQLSIRAR